MTVLKYDENPLLKGPTEPVDFHTDDVRGIYDALVLNLEEHGGLGLAANQIGINKSVFIIKGGLAFFNPYIITYSDEKEYGEEGCLSFPGTYWKIKRAKEIEMEHFSIDGKKNIVKYGGLTARICQHEYDHLNGITFDKRARENRYYYNLYKKKNSKGK